MKKAVILVTTLSVAFPCIEYYSMEALAEHALAPRYQHLWCWTTVVLHVFSVPLSVMQRTCESVLEARRCSVLHVTALEAYWCTEASAALLLSFVQFLLCNLPAEVQVEKVTNRLRPCRNPYY